MNPITDRPMTPYAAALHGRYRHIAYQLRRRWNELSDDGILMMQRARAAAYDDYVQAMAEEATR